MNAAWPLEVAAAWAQGAAMAWALKRAAAAWILERAEAAETAAVETLGLTAVQV